MESSRIPFLEELQLFWKGSVIRNQTEGESSDLSAQRIQFNKAMNPSPQILAPLRVRRTLRMGLRTKN